MRKYFIGRSKTFYSLSGLALIAVVIVLSSLSLGIIGPPSKLVHAASCYAQTVVYQYDPVVQDGDSMTPEIVEQFDPGTGSYCHQYAVHLSLTITSGKFTSESPGSFRYLFFTGTAQDPRCGTIDPNISSGPLTVTGNGSYNGQTGWYPAVYGQAKTYQEYTMPPFEQDNPLCVKLPS